MTLTATTLPGLDPLLQSGVIAVVRVSAAVRLGPAARALAAGGVSLENAGEWIRAGAAAVSVGSALASAALLTDESTAELTARARSFVERVAQARRHPGHAQ